MDKQKEINTKLIGFIIKHERKKKKISASKLAMSIKKSRQYVSDIEKGVKTTSNVTITEIFNFLNIKFIYQECVEVQEVFHKFIDYFYLRDIPNAINRLAAIISNDTYRHTYDYPLVVLSEFIFQELTHQKNMIEEELIDFLDDEKKCIFLYFKAMSYFNKKKYTETLSILKEAKKFEVFIECFKGLILYGEALVYSRINNHLKSLDQNKRAKQCFLKNHNIERSLTCNLHTANIYSKIGRINEAIEIYHDTYYEAKRFNIIRIIQLVHYNLSIALLYNQQFQKSIDEICKLNNGHQMNADYYFVLTWAYFELGNYEESKKNLEKLIQCRPKEIYYQYIITLQSLRLQVDFNKEVYENYLENTIQYVLQNELLSEQIFIMKHAIKYYDQKEDYKNAYRYSNQLNQLLNKRV